MEGFFPASILDEPKTISRQAKCGACGLWEKCESPKMSVSGNGARGILIVGSVPGEAEDVSGRHFAGTGGRHLRKCLEQYRINPESDCWFTNALICKPGRPPTTDEIGYCLPNLRNTIQDLNPRLIIPLGGAAIQSVMMYLGVSLGSEAELVGWTIPERMENRWICPNYNPDDLVVSDDYPAKVKFKAKLMRLWFDRYMEKAFNLLGRPWDPIPPNPEDEVRVFTDLDEAAEWIDRVTDSGGSVSFDFETNCLKPEAAGARIVSVGFCHDGKDTMAVPFMGPVVESTKRFLVSGVSKIGANNKFEERWSQKILGVSVKNWAWDCMLSAHHLDNRPGITSVKFQGFVRLGYHPWDNKVKPVFQADNSMSLNNIHHLDIRTLLVYNALDALIEYRVAKHQLEEMKWQNV